MEDPLDEREADRCANGCELNYDEASVDYNPLYPDGFCASCHDYPEG